MKSTSLSKFLVSDVNLHHYIKAIDDSSEEALTFTLAACRNCARHVHPPEEMLDELEAAMEAAGVEPPEDAERWDDAWSALTVRRCRLDTSG